MKTAINSDVQIGQTKNTAAPLDGVTVGGQLVNESHALKASHDANAFACTLRLDSAVNLPGRIADTKNIEAGASPIRTGFFVDQGQDFLIYGEFFYAVDDLRFHGLTSVGSELGYIAKYVRKEISA